MKASSFVGLLVLTSSSLLQGNPATAVLGFSVPSGRSTKGNLSALSAKKRLQLLEDAPTTTTKPTQQKKKGKQQGNVGADAASSSSSSNAWKNDETQLSRDGPVVVTSGIVRKPLIKTWQELDNNDESDSNNNGVVQQHRRLPRNWQALVDSVKSGTVDVTTLARWTSDALPRTFTRYPKKWAALRSYAQEFEEEQQLQRSYAKNENENGVVVPEKEGLPESDDVVVVQNNIQMPLVFQFVRDWVLTLDTPPPANTVYFQLRNTNVAAFAAAGKSRWSSAEINRALYQIDFMKSATSMATTTTTTSSSNAVKESTPIVVGKVEASDKEEKVVQGLEEKEPAATTHISSSSSSRIMIGATPQSEVAAAIPQPLDVTSVFPQSENKKLQRSKLRGNERSSMVLRDISMLSYNDPILRFPVIARLGNDQMMISSRERRPINQFPAIVPLRPSLTPRRAEFLSMASVVGNKIVFLKKEVQAEGGVLVKGVLWTPMVLQEQQQQSSNIGKMETRHKNLETTTTGYYDQSSNMMTGNDNIATAAQKKVETEDYWSLNLPATYIVQQNLPVA